MIRPAETAELAREFMAFCDGAEEGGLVEYARRGRNLARAAIETAETAASEQSCRRSLQERIETLEGIVMRLHGELDEARRTEEVEA